VRLLGAAFPRASWTTESEAVYTMALGQARIPADAAQQAIATLITEEMMLPPVALVLRRCRETLCSREFFRWRCPECGSRRVVGTLGEAAVCFDCDWKGTLREGDDG